MRHSRTPVIAALLAMSLLVVFASSALAARPAANTTARDAQNQNGGYDHATGSTWGWDNTTPGVALRPYIKKFTVDNGSGPVAVVTENSAVTPTWAPLSASIGGQPSDVYAFVIPTNGCYSGYTQATSPRQCYDSPNRVSITISHFEGGGAGWSPDFTGATTFPQIDQNSVIDIIVGFHGGVGALGYATLGWTWANGIPSGWSASVNPLTGGDVEIKFTPKPVPSSNGMPNTCSTVPVSSCDYTPISADLLAPQIILSMDTTNAAFAGTLFATTASALGAIEIPGNFSSSPSMTYQLAGPHTMLDGSTRSGGLYAVLPDSILSLFGTSVAAFDEALIPVQRSGDVGGGTPAWSTWSTGSGNLSAAKLLSITGITFSAPRFVVGRQSSGNATSTATNGNSSSNSGGSGNGNKVKLGSTTSFKALLNALNLRAAAGSKTTGRTTTPKVCTATKTGIKAIATGTCKGTITVTPKKGKPTKKNFTLVVTKTGKRLPVTFHR